MSDHPEAMVTTDDTMVLLVMLLEEGLHPALHRFMDLVQTEDRGEGDLDPAGSLWGLWLMSSSIRAFAGDGKSLLPADDGNVWALEVLDGAGEALDLDSENPRHVLLGRWLAAVLNQDFDQAAALWWASGPVACGDLLIDVFRLLRDVMLQRQAAQEAADG